MVNRREFLVSASSGAVLAAVNTPLVAAMAAVSTPKRVIVIGAGIVGASIAYNLVKRGCEVLVIEKRGPAAQASGNSFAWVNAGYPNQPASYLALRQFSLAEYHRLAADVDFPIRWNGSLYWLESADEQAKQIKDVANFQATTGSPTWVIDSARAAEIEPNLNPGGDWTLAYSTNDGAVDSEAATRALLDRAQQYGAHVVMPAKVVGVDERADEVRIRTDVDTFSADVVVVAAGVGTTDIAKLIGEDVNTSEQSTPGVIVTTRPMPAIVNTVLYAPRVHLHQQSDGRVILGEKAGPPATKEHRAFLQGRPNAYPDAALAHEHADQILATALEYVPELESAAVERVGIGWRPMSKDGLPLIGHAKHSRRFYFAAMHSGVSLAPAVGHLAAMEILDDVRVELLRDFRPERF